jgi:hypothetical protein
MLHLCSALLLVLFGSAAAGVVVITAADICPGNFSVCAPAGVVALDCGAAPAPPGFAPADNAPVCLVALGSTPLALRDGAGLACTPAAGCEIWVSTTASVLLANASSIVVRGRAPPLPIAAGVLPPLVPPCSARALNPPTHYCCLCAGEHGQHQRAEHDRRCDLGGVGVGARTVDWPGRAHAQRQRWQLWR